MISGNMPTNRLIMNDVPLPIVFSGTEKGNSLITKQAFMQVIATKFPIANNRLGMAIQPSSQIPNREQIKTKGAQNLNKSDFTVPVIRAPGNLRGDMQKIQAALYFSEDLT